MHREPSARRLISPSSPHPIPSSPVPPATKPQRSISFPLPLPCQRRSPLASTGSRGRQPSQPSRLQLLQAADLRTSPRRTCFFAPAGNLPVFPACRSAILNPPPSSSSPGTQPTSAFPGPSTARSKPPPCPTTNAAVLCNRGPCDLSSRRSFPPPQLRVIATHSCARSHQSHRFLNRRPPPPRVQIRSSSGHHPADELATCRIAFFPVYCHHR